MSIFQRVVVFYGKGSNIRGAFHSLVDLQAAINRFVAETNKNHRSFSWTADPDKIIAALKRGHQALESFH